MSAASAKTRAGTRMSGRASTGISQSVSSTRRSPRTAITFASSYVEDHVRAPCAARLLEAQVMVGDRLDEGGGTSVPADQLRLESPHAKVHVIESERNEVLGLGEEQRLRQALRE